MMTKKQARLQVLERIAHVSSLLSEHSRSGYAPGHHAVPMSDWDDSVDRDMRLVSHLQTLLDELDRIDLWSDGE